MLFSDQGSSRPPVVLAISQPAQALISGRILGAWAEPPHDQTLLVCEQHDIAWLDREVSPTLDHATGRPHAFRDVGSTVHVPMWERGLDRACAAWGRRVASLVSRLGSTIYRRHGDRHRSAGLSGKEGDDRAALDYLRRHRSRQNGWMRALGLGPDAVARVADLLAFADMLSLVLCGALPVPGKIDVVGRKIASAMSPATADSYSLDPGPFSPDDIGFEIEARALPPEGRLADEAGMRAWLADPNRIVAHSCRLRRA